MVQKFSEYFAQIDEVYLYTTNAGISRNQLVYKNTGKHRAQSAIRDSEPITTYQDWTIYRDPLAAGRPRYVQYFAYNNKTEQVDIHLEAYVENHIKGLTVLSPSMLSGRQGNQLTAVQFYTLILNAEPVMMVTDAQTIGGLKVWQKLAKVPGITVHGYEPQGHGKLGKPIHVDLSEPQTTHITQRQINRIRYDPDSNYDLEIEADILKNTQLVAFATKWNKK